MVAIPALSYPRFFKIVNPSSKNSRASGYFSVPTTPTMPQQSVDVAPDCSQFDAANEVIANITPINAAAFHEEE
jgi:hypothetical protein